MSYNNALAHIFGFGNKMAAEIEPFRAFIWGPLGGTIACCYILLAFIAWFPFRRKERWARNAIIVAFAVWVVLDSSVCLYYGVYFQVYIINGFSILIKALPVIFTWKEFKKETRVIKQRNYLFEFEDRAWFPNTIRESKSISYTFLHSIFLQKIKYINP